MAKKAPQDDFRQYFPDIGVDEPEDKKPVDATQALLEKMAALEARVTAKDRENDTLRAQQAALVSQPLIKTTEGPKYVELPDPVVDQAAYAKAVAHNVRAELQHERDLERAQQSEQLTQQQRMNGLWDTFSTKYEAYAKDQTKVKIAVKEVAAEAQAKGLDVNKYMFLTPDQFMNDVKGKMDSLGWGVAADTNAGGDDDDEDDNRTIGIAGGMESQGRVTRGEDKSAGSIYDGLKDWQIKTGFHR